MDYPENEYSLDLFTDYRSEANDYTYTSDLGIELNFDKKTISLSNPITFVEIYSEICDLFDSNFDLMTFEMPMFAVTQNYFELKDGWTFVDDSSRKNVLEAGWTEGADQWISIAPLGCLGDITNFSYSWSAGERNVAVWGKFERLTQLSECDSGQTTEAIKVVGNAGQLYLNLYDENAWVPIRNVAGIKTFKGIGVISVPVMRTVKIGDNNA